MSRHRLSAIALLAGLATSPAIAKDPIVLSDMGSFHVGGKLVEITGKPVKEVTFTKGGVPAKVDLNGTYMAGQMYAQYFIPQKPRGRYPLLMWHGGGLTGVTWETTPDGREGWQQWFLRQGWPVYTSDAVERGRASWAMYPDILEGEPVFLPVANPYERFRIGAGAGSYDEDPAKRKLLEGNQFPVEAYADFVKQVVPRWTTTDDLINEAYVALLDRVGESVVMVHSQSGQFGLRAAQARPDKVKALILVEPAALGDPDQAAKLQDIPILAIYGDYIEQDARWPKIRENGLAFYEKVRDAGGTVDVVDLPEVGIEGNSHMVMMDKNSDQVAQLIQDWLAEKGLWE